MKPTIASYRNYDEGLRFVVETIVRLCQQGKYRPGDIAVLGRFKRSFNVLTNLLDKAALGYRHFRSEDFQILENYVKLVTMHSAKGLEFPVVFIIGLDDNFFPFVHPTSRTRQEDELLERKPLLCEHDACRRTPVSSVPAEQPEQVHPRVGREYDNARTLLD